MALQVWLPLNGDLTNNGLENVTIYGSGTFTPDGKIGKCLSGGSTISITSQTLANSKTWSICFWGYVVSANVTDNWTRLIRMSDGGDYLRVEVCPKSYGSGIFCYSTHNNAAYKITTDSLSAPSGGFYDQWHHFCMTSDGTTICVYDNGTLRGTMSYNGSGAITGTFTLDNNSIIKKNDFRIYNTCLSPREVSELSKALILHYPMTGGGRGGANFAKGTNTASIDTNEFRFSEATGGSTPTIEYDGGIPCAKITRNSTAHSGWSYLHYDNWHRNAIKPDTWYTLSMDIKGSDGNGNVGVVGFLQGNATNSITDTIETIQNNFTTEWSHLVYYIHTISDFTGKGASQVIYMSCGFLNGVDRWIIMKNLHLEEGRGDSNWIPHFSDAAYTIMGYNDNIEYDVSGYNYNGTKVGTLDYSSDTPRYSVCTHFTAANSQYITLPAMILDMTKFSVAAWFKADTAQFWSRILDMGEKTEGKGYALMLTLGQDGTTFRLAGRGSSGTTFPDTTIQSINLGQWYHIVVTIEDKTCKSYVNGELVKTFTMNQTFSTATPMNLNYIGKSNFSQDRYYDGNISDVRIYTTALSADQVARLYNTPVSLSNNGTLLTQGEFMET